MEGTRDLHNIELELQPTPKEELVKEIREKIKQAQTAKIKTATTQTQVAYDQVIATYYLALSNLI